MCVRSRVRNLQKCKYDSRLACHTHCKHMSPVFIHYMTFVHTAALFQTTSTRERGQTQQRTCRSVRKLPTDINNSIGFAPIPVAKVTDDYTTLGRIVKTLFFVHREAYKRVDIGNTHTRRHARRGARKMSAKKVSH